MAAAQFGHGTLLLAFVTALFGIVLCVVGDRKRLPALAIGGVRAVGAVTGLLLVAAAVLLAAFLRHDFSLAYVSGRSSSDMPLRYVITAFYGGQEGSLLFWAIVSGVLASIAFLRHRARFPRIVPYASAVFLSLQAFMLYMLCFVASPFELNAIVPTEGRGLNPLLRDPGMMIHPPMLLSGYASFAVPFSIAAGALIAGSMSRDLLRYMRQWALIAWAILGTGIFLGGWWAYHVLGWGGYWGWDPVENVSLLPWLTATAFIHSVIVQERRGMLKVWNVALLLASFVLAVFGTFVVRSGLIQSVHSFALSDIGPYFLGYLIAVTILAVGLMIWRLPMLQSENTFDSMVSRESSFLLNNLVFAGIAFATFWGTVYPLVSDTLRGQEMTVGPQFYNQVNGPLFLILLVLMGIGPLLAWRRADTKRLLRVLAIPLGAAMVVIVVMLVLFGQPMAAAGAAAAVFAAVAVLVEYWRGTATRRRNSGDAIPVALYRLVRREPRRFGGYIVHLGVALIAIGIVGSTFFQSERQVAVSPGERFTLAGYDLEFIEVSDTMTADARVWTAYVRIWVDGEDQGTIEAKRFFYRNFENQPTTVVATETVGFDDVYIMLTEWDDSGRASLHVFVNPLVSWIWGGGLVYLLGMVMVFWPPTSVQPMAVRSSVRSGSGNEIRA